MLNWYTHVLTNYAAFSGRARRAEYWNFVLVNFIISLVLALAGWVIHMNWLDTVYALATLIPSLAVGVRRLHDTNRSGWWWLIVLIPFIGAIVLIVFAIQEGTPGPNQYGPDPKMSAAAVPA